MSKLSPIARLTDRQAQRMLKALDVALEYAGGWTALAALHATYTDEPCTPQALFRWTVRGIPAERAVELEHATGGIVLRQHLRPDLFDGMRSEH